jgi:hypothetical protein
VRFDCVEVVDEVLGHEKLGQSACRVGAHRVPVLLGSVLR